MAVLSAPNGNWPAHHARLNSLFGHFDPCFYHVNVQLITTRTRSPSSTRCPDAYANVNLRSSVATCLTSLPRLTESSSPSSSGSPEENTLSQRYTVVASALLKSSKPSGDNSHQPDHTFLFTLSVLSFRSKQKHPG